MAWTLHARPEPRTVLVVEDDDVTRAFLLDNLAADGFRVAGATGAGEGLRAIEVRQLALVVLDLVLEDGSGLALLDRVRAADGLSSRIDPDLPVIVLSGRAGDADRVRSFARGADDHLCKPTRHLFSRCRAAFRRCAPLSCGSASPGRRIHARDLFPDDGGVSSRAPAARAEAVARRPGGDAPANRPYRSSGRP